MKMSDKHAHELKLKQLSFVRQLTTIMVLTSILNVVVVLFCFRDTLVFNSLLIWTAAVVVLNIVSVARKYHLDRSKVSVERALNFYVRLALSHGLIWGAVPFLVMHTADNQGHMILGIQLAGIMFAGSFLQSRIPLAAYAFMFPISLGVAGSMIFTGNPQDQFVAVLSLVYLAVLLLAVRWSHEQFIEQHLNAAAVKEQSQVISLLLRDFEESTSDWLWQTDTDGVLMEIPLAVEGVEHENDNVMIGNTLVSLFQRDESSWVLETSLMRKESFRDLVMKVQNVGDDRWWSLTGKPIYEDGVFKGFRGVAKDVTQSKEIEDRIAYMAHYDGLTGLPNRVSMQEQLEKAMRKPLIPQMSRALVWLDLDNFKWVNDTLGHPAGDELLQHVGARLQEVCDERDVVARISGDEFALIVERPSDGQLETFLDRLTDYLSEPYDLWGSTANCSASVGVRLFDSEMTDSRVILKHADLALYQAKKVGKANWCMFTQELDDRARARLQVESDLHHAVNENEFKVYFQPQVNAHTHQIVGCETLVRWQHPTRGLVYPGEFIEHAEDNGLITRIGDWVLRAALSEARKLPEHIRISVNISPVQIHSANLIPTIVHAIAANNIDPSRLELEVTENVLMSDTEFTLQRLHQLKEIGIRIALDDFGTGYSSLSYLRRFPFDRIKIDKSFVRDIETRSDSRSIAVATLSLAKSLGMRCTAEGVETRYQADFLRDCGCDELQGFFISRAQPLEKLQHMIELKKVQEKVTLIQDQRDFMSRRASEMHRTEKAS
ncbi:putative bifunctional diguanylate cyclase/phosphodiesterase [Hyphomonas pacifica]|uniref:putative bifunctional diguanylate cyclase/phosphodiesterase n=1 Tax=Hyphomonas pacifica TaxID=1280941 RepID=UPI001F437643|nr:EAL domain-containing protein [Hyphomonas pacifica]